MKKWNQTADQINALIATGEALYIISGDGENGTREPYDGKETARAIKARLTKERAGGRWARLDTESGHALAGII